MPKTVPGLVEALDQMTGDKPGTPAVVLTLVERSEHKEKPQDEPLHDAPLPAASLPYGLLVLLSEEFDLGLMENATTFLGLPSSSAILPPVLPHHYLHLPPLPFPQLLGH